MIMMTILYENKNHEDYDNDEAAMCTTLFLCLMLCLFTVAMTEAALRFSHDEENQNEENKFCGALLATRPKSSSVFSLRFLT